MDGGGLIAASLAAINLLQDAESSSIEGICTIVVAPHRLPDLTSTFPFHPARCVLAGWDRAIALPLL